LTSQANTPSGAAIAREVDAYGRVHFRPEDAFELLYRGIDIPNLIMPEDDALRAYNALCRRFDKAEHQVLPEVEPNWTPEEEHQRRANSWRIPEPYASLDVRAELLGRCTTDEQRARVEMEMDMFEARGLLPVLRLMFALVVHFRENGIVWGVGRGSSVASYCLYLIGVHKIDALKFGLDIREFLK